jgi:hypothetical protein
MATQNVCPYNKYGFCKHREMCRNLHVAEVCESSSCVISSCLLRHPKNCKYYTNYGRCKFDPCAYKHIDNQNTFERNTQENEIIKAKLKHIEEQLKELNEKEIETKLNMEKLKKIEEKVEDMKSYKEDMKTKDDVIEELTRKLNTMETSLKEKDNVINRLSNKVRELEESCGKIEILERKIYVIEKKNAGNIFCKFCDEEFEESRDLQIHTINTHTFECQVCDFKAENKEMLDIHVSTCEVYECQGCDYSHKRLSEMKTHCKTRHTNTKPTLIVHVKMDRETFSERTYTNYWSNKI